LEFNVEKEYLNSVAQKCNQAMQYKNDLEYKISYYRHSNYYGKLKQELDNLDLSKLKKLKVDELKEICIKYEISLTKISDKTSKMINKTKTELIEDIEAYIKK